MNKVTKFAISHAGEVVYSHYSPHGAGYGRITGYRDADILLSFPINLQGWPLSNKAFLNPTEAVYLTKENPGNGWWVQIVQIDLENKPPREVVDVTATIGGDVIDLEKLQAEIVQQETNRPPKDVKEAIERFGGGMVKVSSGAMQRNAEGAPITEGLLIGRTQSSYCFIYFKGAVGAHFSLNGVKPEDNAKIAGHFMTYCVDALPEFGVFIEPKFIVGAGAPPKPRRWGYLALLPED